MQFGEFSGNPQVNEFDPYRELDEAEINTAIANWTPEDYADLQREIDETPAEELPSPSPEQVARILARLEELERQHRARNN